MTTLGQFDPELTQLVVDDETSRAIKVVVGRLHRDCHATAVLLLDQAGQIIVWRGAAFGEERVQLGALVAGVFASTREVAKILREQAFKTCIQEGGRENVFTESIGSHWLLSVIFSKRAHLGLVKLRSGRAAIELNDVLERALVRSRLQPRWQDSRVRIAVSDTIDLLVRNDIKKTVD